MKHSKVFRASQIAIAVAATVASLGGIQVAHAGAGWGDNLDFNGNPIKVPTFYANSPSGLRANANPSPGVVPVVGGQVNTGKALRKFVDGLPGLTPANANNLGQYLPLAVSDTASYPGSDYFEIAVVEYTEKMHSDLPKATTLRGYVQIETPANAANSRHVALTYPSGSPILDAAGNQIFAVDNPHYLGPVVLATKGKAVRFKFTNLLPVGGFNAGTGQRNGDLFLPVDTTLLGSGAVTDSLGAPLGLYSQNRAEIHLHGGDTPWISDGTPHQWVAPAGEMNPTAATPVTPSVMAANARGVSTQNVPDMPDPGPGAVTYYFPNNQSARLMFYHDHASGLTRLNVYGGEAAGYVLLDTAEAALYAAGALPGGPLDMIPLVLQDKTFVPEDIADQDARWDTAHWGQPGDLWFPHVYETNQDPNSFDGTNPVGRWDYGPWFWPVFPAPLAMPTGVYGDVSTTPEAFADTPVVNGTAYPTLSVDPKAYRFRLLNAGNDRFLNLGLYVADPAVTTADGRKGTEVKMVPATAPIASSPLQACAPGAPAPTLGMGAPCWPDNWPTDGRAEGVPDPASVGPDIIVIGNEGGFLPEAHVIPSGPTVYELNRRSITVMNVLTFGVFLGNAERADAVIDFSAYAGKTLILYNDAPTPIPAFDPRTDYFTGNADQTGAGGAESTKAGYGPNTRTYMQIKVAATRADGAAIAPFDVAKLQAALPAAYAAGSDRPVVGQSAYNKAFGTNYTDNYAKIRTGTGQQPQYIWTPSDTAQTIMSATVTDGGLGYLVPPEVVFVGGDAPLTPPGAAFTPAVATATVADGRVTGINFSSFGTGYTSAPRVFFRSAPSGGIGATASVVTSMTQSKTVQNKAIQELFDPNYGRMNATLGVEMPFSTSLVATTVPLGYIDPPTEFLAAGETQIWKITHNGVDTHPVHFHLMNVQLINRVGWDGTIKPPSPSELGWKETIRMHPLEDIIVAVSPKTPLVPFGVPDSIRLRDPSQAFNTNNGGFTQVDLVPGSPTFGQAGVGANSNVKNTSENFEWEYVWHCHILGHEENDFMRPVVFRFGALAPDAPTSPAVSTAGVLSWTDATPAADPATMLSKKNEISFRVERVEQAVLGAEPAAGDYVTVGSTLANATTFTDTTVTPGKGYWYRVVAVNAKGTAASTAVSMTATGDVATLAPDAVVATAISSTVVNLTWNDNSANESGFLIERCVSTSLGVCSAAFVTLTTTAANIKAYSDATASASTYYVYRVTARNAAGDSAPALSGVVQTLAAPANAPSKLALTVKTDTTATLTWQDNSSAPINEAGFLVQRSANGGVTWVDLATAGLGTVPQNGGATALNLSVAADVITYADTGLTQNTTYLYRVAAVTAGGAATSTPITVLTNYAAAPAAGPLTGPVTPLWNQLSLSWPVAAPSTSFVISRTGGAAAFAPVTVAGNAVGAVGPNTYVDNAVIQNTAYTYTVQAVNGPNNGVVSASTTITTAFAPAPALSGLSATVNGLTQVNVGWNPEAVGSYTTGVRLDRCIWSAANFNCTSPTSVFTSVFVADKAGATPLPVTWTDNTVAASTSYTYRANFVNGPANVGAAATASASIPASFAIAPPINLAATLWTTYARITWTDNSTNETAFTVERSVDGVNFASIGSVVGQPSTGFAYSFSDVTVAPGNSYKYRVKAVNVVGTVTTDSPYAGPVAIDMTIAPPSNMATVVTATQVAVSWRDNALYDNGYNFYRSADGGATWTLAATTTASASVGQGATLTVNDSALALVPGTTYSYKVEARWVFNGVTYTSTPATASATTLPLLAPSGLIYAVAPDKITLAWRDNSVVETNFTVERSSDGITWDPAVTVPARGGSGGTVAYTDVVLTLGTTYSYRVSAVNVASGITTTATAPVITVVYAVPPAPATITVLPWNAGTFKVSWDNVAGETSFTVQRRRITTPQGPYMSWGNTGVDVTSAFDSGRTSGQLWQYAVRANNALGSSAWTESPITGVMVP